jgi:curli biogenesis system outer membrane secretion channel CsgG
MKKTIPLLLLCVSLAGCGASVKTVVRGEFDPAARVAVMPFGGRDEETSLSLAEAFSTYLMEAGFDVMERAQLEKVLGEQKISLSGALAEADVAQVGRLTGVKAVVTGSYRVRREHVRTVTPRVKLPPMQARPGKRPLQPVRQAPGEVREETNTIFSGLTVKFVDVGTGRVLLSCSSEKDYDASSVNKALAAMAASIKKELKNRKGD